MAGSAATRVVVSGFRPTGRLHLGHLLGALRNWVQLQEGNRCYFFVADYHALTTDYAHPSGLQESAEEMVIDWLAAGLDPARSVLFRQSGVPAHAELALLLSMIVPVPWLERTPTYKEQREQLRDRDLSTHGFLGYPVLQAADILMYKATHVPVGQDQVPHIELTREIARRFNNFYGSLFVEPQPLLSAAPKIAGTDGRKMSKSYNNAVLLSDPPADIERKLTRMATDPRRVRRDDPGEPEDCPAFTSLHRLYCTPAEIDYVTRGCRTAGIGCRDCKAIMARHVVAELEPIRERRRDLEARRGDVREILEAGSRQATGVAARTMAEVRRAMGLDSGAAR